MRESFFSERLASVDLSVFAFGSANAHPDKDIVFQNVKRATHAIRRPISGIADTVDFFGRSSFFFILLAQTFFFFLVALFLFCFTLVAAEGLLPKIFRITRLGRSRIALGYGEADRFVEGLGGVKTLQDSKTSVGLFAAFGVLDRRILTCMDLVGRCLCAS